MKVRFVNFLSGGGLLSQFLDWPNDFQISESLTVELHDSLLYFTLFHLV